VRLLQGQFSLGLPLQLLLRMLGQAQPRMQSSWMFAFLGIIGR
jgi:hypothetical protein